MNTSAPRVAIGSSLRRASLLIALSALAACADLGAARQDGQNPAESAAQADCNKGLGAEENTRLALIQKLIDDGKPYAALAHLDGSPTYPMVRYLRAESLRKTGQFVAAITEYSSLLGSCYDGYGEHGLGLIAAENGKLADALPHLLAARERRPTDPRIRSDYGYALMLNHDYAAARIEFMTAIELDPGNKLASANLAKLDQSSAERTPVAVVPTPPISVQGNQP
jgi:Flp pilus assembly protein TadD